MIGQFSKYQCKGMSGTVASCGSSVAERLTRDRWAAGSSLTSITALCPGATTLILAVLVQPRKKTHPFITERLLMGSKESNQTKTAVPHVFCILASKLCLENWSQTKWGSNCKVTGSTRFYNALLLDKFKQLESSQLTK